ncbi:type II toxin-antitoxin system RelE/ParE family toxin [Aromatoleum toluclasticum]|uniref:type II toxin-antitoxin system RelE/ParE family toxin n=1 Tax=Aromatoleum toluclasticum TaxID=92003 RepID=UPI00036E4AE8|nr:type II toxin-antitoxin system RelE/ParE family toxin [Aromatoleum toluclasticum]MCC4116302.1 type II toxin-antitoxin system RelE/ParE family toxin [Aromatoleum toluclasticum]
MAHIELAPEIADDFERILEHLANWQIERPEERVREIVEAIDILSHSPLIGRPGHAGKRELVIGRGSHGYVALYRYHAEIDTVFVLAIKSQREAGYSHG